MVSVGSSAVTAGYGITHRVIRSDSISFVHLFLSIAAFFWILGVAIVSYFAHIQNEKGESEQASQQTYPWMAKIAGPLRRSVRWLFTLSTVMIQLIRVYNT